MVSHPAVNTAHVQRAAHDSRRSYSECSHPSPLACMGACFVAAVNEPMRSCHSASKFARLAQSDLHATRHHLLMNWPKPSESRAYRGLMFSRTFFARCHKQASRCVAGITARTACSMAGSLSVRIAPGITLTTSRNRSKTHLNVASVSSAMSDPATILVSPVGATVVNNPSFRPCLLVLCCEGHPKRRDMVS